MSGADVTMNCVDHFLKIYTIVKETKIRMDIWRLWMVFGVYLLFIVGHSGSTIVGCEQGKVDVEEGTNHSFSCVELPGMIYDSNGRALCYCSSYYYYYYSYWSCQLVIYFGVSEYLYSCYQNSYLTVIPRDSASRIMWDYYGTRAYCSLNIYATPVYQNDSCDVSISDWMVTGSCNITGMYSSDNNYTCSWREQNNTKEEFGGWNVLEGYNAANTRLYMRGVCSFTRPIPCLNGSYTYTMRVSPGSDEFYHNTIIIASPDQVQLNHSCPSYVLEGSSVVCTCNASTTGSPPGLLAWYEMTDETLLLTNVSRNTSGKQFTCRLEWGSNGAIRAMISYMLTVAYGPSDVIINRIAETADDQSGIIRFICSAISFYPSVMFRWNITCESQTDYTHFSVCSINITHRVDRVMIECTATNTHFPQVSFSRVYELTVEDGPSDVTNTYFPEVSFSTVYDLTVEDSTVIQREPESKKSSAEGVNTAVVGVVGAAAIVLLIIVSVLVVFIIKRQVFKRPKSHTSNDHQSAYSEEIYSIPDFTIAGHGVDNAAFNEMIESSGTRHVTYDNRCVTLEIAMNPLTKPMPAIAGKHSCEDISDTSCGHVARCNEDENIYENVGN